MNSSEKPMARGTPALHNHCTRGAKEAQGLFCLADRAVGNERRAKVKNTITGLHPDGYCPHLPGIIRHTGWEMLLLVKTAHPCLNVL